MLMLGLHSKKKCPNTKTVDMVRSLKDYKTKVSVYDPCANPSKVNDA